MGGLQASPNHPRNPPCCAEVELTDDISLKGGAESMRLAQPTTIMAQSNNLLAILPKDSPDL